MKTLTIVDTFGIFFRSFHALPPTLKNADGFPTGLITGFINFIYTLEEEHKTDYIIFALDSKGKKFRHDIDPNYKANRSAAPEDLKMQLPVAIELIEKMGFTSFLKDGLEADDIIAAIVKSAQKNSLKIRIISHDKDLYQLIEESRVVIFDPIKKEEINRDKCFDKFGVFPERIEDYLSIVGDTADNIPGVKGIGAKGAKKLIDEFGDLENIYKNLSKISNQRVKKLLQESYDNAFLSQKLVRLDDSFDIPDKIENFIFPIKHPLKNIIDELEKYELRSIISRLNITKEPREKLLNQKFKPILLDTPKELFAILDTLTNHSIIAFDTETTGLDVRSADIVGFSFALDEQNAYYVPIGHSYLGVQKQISLQDAKKAIEKIYTCKVIGHNLKYDFAIIKRNFNIIKVENFVDTMVLAWLLNSQYRVGLDAVAKRMFKYNMIKFKDVVSKGGDFSGGRYR